MQVQKDVGNDVDSVLLLANVLILNDSGQLLVMRRSKTAPRAALSWDFPGGIVKHGEDPAAAAVRETFEETGLSLGTLKILHVASRNLNGYVIKFTYLARVQSDNIALSYEHDRFQWVELAEVDDLDMPSGFKRDARRLSEWLSSDEVPDAFDYQSN